MSVYWPEDELNREAVWSSIFEALGPPTLGTAQGLASVDSIEELMAESGTAMVPFPGTQATFQVLHRWGLRALTLEPAPNEGEWDGLVECLKPMFARVYDARFEQLQNEENPRNLERLGVDTTTLKLIDWGAPGFETVDLSENPGRTEYCHRGVAAIGHVMWFSHEYSSHLRLSFEQSELVELRIGSTVRVEYKRGVISEPSEDVSRLRCLLFERAT